MLDGLSGWALTDGKIGDRVHCLGVAEHLGLAVEERFVRPRRPWSWFAPFGPPDPLVDWSRSDGASRPPLPAIAIASGRRTVPTLRALKRGSGGRVFTVMLKDPRCGKGAADVIWVPEHDYLRGPNVIVTLTSPSRLSPAKLAAARAAPDPRLAALPAPRTAMLLGGPSGRYHYDAGTTARLLDVARTVVAGGGSLMVTPSRRTPPGLVAAILALAEGAALRSRVFVWQGEEPNPYLDMLALADALVVTGDSVNMLGEAALTGAPIHVVEPAGGHPKMTRFIDGLVAHGAARRWSGTIEQFTYAPLDATPTIAAAIAERYRAFIQDVS
jgi:mitochondrial fission protein ELM1